MAIEFHYEKRIDNSAVVRNIDGRQRKQWFLMTLLASLFVLSLFFYGWQYYRGIKVGYDQVEAARERQELIEANQRYRAQLDNWTSLDRVGDIAVAMGMVRSAAGQKVAMRTSPSDALDRTTLALATKE
jgi:hypothetical protein